MNQEDMDFLTSQASNIGPRVTPAGQDTSTIKVDHTPSVTDVRTPTAWLPVQNTLAGQLGLPADQLRMIRGSRTELGAITLWEILDPDLATVVNHVLAAHIAGISERLKVVFARERGTAEVRWIEASLNHGLLGPA